MISVRFKNLKESELVKEAIEERLQDDFERFPDLSPQGVNVTVEMENSPIQAGPDLFRVKLRVTRGRYRGVILEKTGKSFYTALSDLNDVFVERLNRFGDKRRVVQRKRARRGSAKINKGDIS